MDHEPRAFLGGISGWQKAMLIVVFLIGILPPGQILFFLAKGPWLGMPEDRLWGCYYPLLCVATMAMTLYSVADERRRRLTCRATAVLLSLLLLFPAVVTWCAFFEANTRLIPPYYGLYPWLPTPVNLFALTTTVRLSRRGWIAVVGSSALAVGILLSLALPAVWPIVERIRRQYPPAREILALGEADISPTSAPHIRWDDFWVTGVLARDTWMGDGKAELIYQFPRLRRLDLSGTHVGDAGMRYVDTLSNLEEVYLSRTQIGDPTLEKLSRLPHLSWLELKQTAVTDAGLEHLIDLKELGEVSLDGTQVTPEGVARFLKRYEDKTGRRCEVSYSGLEVQPTSADKDAEKGTAER